MKSENVIHTDAARSAVRFHNVQVYPAVKASPCSKSGSQKTVDQIRDYVDREFKRAGFYIPVSVGICMGGPLEEVVMLNPSLELIFIPADKQGAFSDVLKFPELTDEERGIIQFAISQGTDDKETPGILILP